MIKLNRKIILSLILVFIFMVIRVSSFGFSFNISGYYKSFFSLLSNKSVISPDGLTDMPDFGLVTNSLRLKSLFRISSAVTLNVAYDVFPSITYKAENESSFLITFLEPSLYRFGDLDPVLYPAGNNNEGNFTINNNLDRFFITVKTEKADFFIGRQSISWGSSRVFNPTDIIAPFNFNQLDKEEKSGVDAIRVRVPLGTMNELDAGYVFGDKFRFSQSAFFARAKFNILKSDISILMSGFRGNFLLGFDLSSSIGGAGIWAECALVKTGFFIKKAEESINSYFRASVGADYNFAGNTYAFIEYHYNSAGNSDPERYLSLFESTPFLDGNVYQMGKHYISLGVNKQLHPLIGFNNLIIFSITDNSLIFSPVLEYNIAENIYISAGGFLGFGKRPEKASSQDPSGILLRSEFGTYPNLIYSSFRIYF